MKRCLKRHVCCGCAYADDAGEDMTDGELAVFLTAYVACLPCMLASAALGCVTCCYCVAPFQVAKAVGEAGRVRDDGGSPEGEAERGAGAE